MDGPVITTLKTLRNRLRFKRRFGGQHQAVARALYPDGDIRVRGGPFAGMRYLNETVWGPITPKWLGSYEVEIAPIIERIRERGYERVIDVGCAEGYYACGLAHVMPGVRVRAYDTDFISRGQTRRLARLNGCEERVTVARFCSHDDLADAAGALLICDIEGHERELLDPERCPALRECDILVEIHENRPGVGTEELLRRRFGDSHRIERHVAEPRAAWVEAHAAEFPELDRELLRQAVREYRSDEQPWLWMEAGA